MNSYKAYVGSIRKMRIFWSTLEVIGATFDIITPLFLSLVIDKIITNSLSLNLLNKYISILLLIAAISYFLISFASYNILSAFHKCEQVFSANIFKKILTQSQVFYSKNTTGSLLSKVSNDIVAIAEFVSFGLYSLIDSTSVPIISLIIMISTISLKLTIITLIPVSIIIILNSKLEPIYANTFRRIQEIMQDINHMALENINGIRTIKSFNNKKISQKIFNLKVKQLEKQRNKMAYLISFYRILGSLISFVSTFIAFTYGAFMISSGEITVGKLIAFSIYISRFEWPIIAFGEYLTLKIEKNESEKRVDSILNYKEEIDYNNGEIINSIDEIKFNDFSFRYSNNDEYKLKNINLSINKNEKIGICGKVGSGKSTLLKQLLIYYPINKKSISINNKFIEELNTYSIRNNLSYVPQEYYIFSDTIKENILLGEDYSDKEILEAIKMADFQKDVDSFENGIYTLTGENGITISGGQKQRLQIARAFLRKKDLIIIDDGLSAVDSITQSKIISNLNNIKGSSVIISSHTISLISGCDKIIVLDDGRISAKGTHLELLEICPWYKKQYIHQQMEK